MPSKINDDDALARLRQWEAAGGPVLEQSVLTPAPPPPAEPVPKNLDARHFHRSIDTTWRRTSYSGLIRVAETSGVSSEPEVVALDDEVGDLPLLQPSTGPHVPSPMADLPKGAKFGTLVHAVLETADPFAADLAAELETHVREHSVWWPVDVPAPDLAAALVPMHDTPLGPLAADLTLRQIGLRDRLREMDFEFPLAGGDMGATAPGIHLRDVGRPGGRVPARRRPACLLRRAADGRRAGQPVAARVSERVRSTRCCASRTGMFPAAIATWSSTTSRTGWATATAP